MLKQVGLIHIISKQTSTGHSLYFFDSKEAAEEYFRNLKDKDYKSFTAPIFGLEDEREMPNDKEYYDTLLKNEEVISKKKSGRPKKNA